MKNQDVLTEKVYNEGNVYSIAPLALIHHRFFKPISILITSFALAVSAFACGGSEDEPEVVCEEGHFGPNCDLCTCEHGTCNDGKDGDGKCSACDEGYWGENCASNTITCRHGTPSTGIAGNGKCASCNNKWSGDSCDTCNEGYGEDCLAYGSMNDRAGKTYKTVVINGQTWMAENMSYSGEGITCHANILEAPYGDPDFLKKYGCLYIWEEAKQVCPDGWSLPTKDNFGDLLSYAGGENSTGAKNLQAADFNNGKDTYGFGALPAGLYYSQTDTFYRFGEIAQFWSGTEASDSLSAHHFVLDSDSASLDVSIKAYGFSVRCIKKPTVTE